MFDSFTFQYIYKELISIFYINFPQFLFRVVISIAVIIFFYVIRRIVLRFISKIESLKAPRGIWRSASSYLAITFGIIALIPVWLPSLQNFAAVLGIFGAGILLVNKELILNGVAWGYILIRRPFEPGHRISIQGFTGDVIEIRILEFTMLEVRPMTEGGQSTGRVIRIPNSLLFTVPLANASKEFAFYWHEIQITLSLKSNWKKAEKILLEETAHLARKIDPEDKRILISSEEYDIHYKKLDPRVFYACHDGKIILTLRFLVEPRQSRQIESEIWKAILNRFAMEKDVHLI